ncbi:hypothetical protein ABEB36_002521 [Hypothenemus hampei]|uniref:Uncharacterized protein n=1 Tax=Hypothenemus hampei TaxID=57062 RepID=A0ABD1F618_HYPHA
MYKSKLFELSIVFCLWQFATSTPLRPESDHFYYELVPLNSENQTEGSNIFDSSVMETTTKNDVNVLFKNLYRTRRQVRYPWNYMNRFNDYDDDDYNGNNRRGTLNGYMDDHDDFPTVVW